MLSFYEHLRRQHGLPVLPVALYLRVGLKGIGWDVYEETYWDQRLLHFSYAYVGLPGLKGEVYVAGEHLLGVALTALMGVPPERRAAVHAEALRRLAEARENDYRRYLLLDCLEAYASLDKAQRRNWGSCSGPSGMRGPERWRSRRSRRVCRRACKRVGGRRSGSCSSSASAH